MILSGTKPFSDNDSSFWLPSLLFFVQLTSGSVQFVTPSSRWWACSAANESVCWGLLIVHAVCISVWAAQRLQCGGWGTHRRHVEVKMWILKETHDALCAFFFLILFVVTVSKRELDPIEMHPWTALRAFWLVLYFRNMMTSTCNVNLDTPTECDASARVFGQHQFMGVARRPVRTVL